MSRTRLKVPRNTSEGYTLYPLVDVAAHEAPMDSIHTPENPTKAACGLLMLLAELQLQTHDELFQPSIVYKRIKVSRAENDDSTLSPFEVSPE